MLSMLGRTKKGGIVLGLALLVLIVILPSVQAQLGCCLKTTDEKFCVDNARADRCVEGFFFTGKDCSSKADCQSVTCIPAEGECQAGKMKFECQAMRGKWDADPLSEVEDCQEGCVNILGQSCNILQKKVGYEKAEEAGFKREDVTFTAGETLEECKAQCAGAERGTCVLGGGLCEYTTADICAGKADKFERNTFASQVAACAVKESHSYKGCGVLAGDENKVCWFNDQASQEDCVEDCNYPQGMCRETEEQGERTAYCKSTSCNIKLPDKDSQGRAGKQSLLSGTSMCYNFHKDEKGRTTGLQHYVLHCALGEVNVEGLGPDRNKICVEDKENVVGRVVQNKWQYCRQCGTADGFFERIAGAAFSHYVFGGFGEGYPGEKEGEKAFTATPSEEFEIVGGAPQTTPLEGWSPVPAEETGLAVAEPVEVGRREAGYATAAGALLGAGDNEIGDVYQIVPIAVPPGPFINAQIIGSACGDGLSIFNDESPGEFGDCKYEGFLWDGLGSSIPKVAPGSPQLCHTCGGGGDETWNICGPDECNALGNCQESHAFSVDMAFRAWATYAVGKSSVAVSKCTIGCSATSPLAWLKCATACWKAFGAEMSKTYDQTIGSLLKKVGLNPTKTFISLSGGVNFANQNIKDVTGFLTSGTGIQLLSDLLPPGSDVAKAADKISKARNVGQISNILVNNGASLEDVGSILTYSMSYVSDKKNRGQATKPKEGSEQKVTETGGTILPLVSANGGEGRCFIDIKTEVTINKQINFMVYCFDPDENPVNCKTPVEWFVKYPGQIQGEKEEARGSSVSKTFTKLGRHTVAANPTDYNDYVIPTCSQTINVVAETPSEQPPVSTPAVPATPAVPGEAAAAALPEAIKAVEKTKENNWYKYSKGVIMGLAMLEGAGIEAGYECHAEKPRRGKETKLCRYCGGLNNSYRLCTQERCEILGLCKAVPDPDEGDYSCVEAPCTLPEGQNPPKVEKIHAKFLLGTATVAESDSEKSGKSVYVDAGLLAWNVTHVEISIKTNLGSHCRFSTEGGKAWGEMTDFDGAFLYPREQSVTVSAGGAERQHRIFIKCQQICGVENPAEWDYYYVKYELDKLPDFLPPEIVYVDPYSVFVSESLGTVKATVKLNENGNCYYSKELNATEVGEMEQMTCQQNSACVLTKKNACSTCTFNINLDDGKEVDMGELTGVSGAGSLAESAEQEGINKTKVSQFVFICKDLQGNEAEPFDYMLATVSDYDMKIVKPGEGDVIYDREITLEVDTGQRATECRYALTDKPFSDCTSMNSIAASHITEVGNLTTGSHTLYVKCKDFAWQIKEASVSFTVQEDNSPPMILRAYHYVTDIGKDVLRIITDEESTCVYSLESLNYAFEDGIGMPYDEGKEHIAEWPFSTYYVKCKDEFDNLASYVIKPQGV